MSRDERPAAKAVSAALLAVSPFLLISALLLAFTYPGLVWLPGLTGLALTYLVYVRPHRQERRHAPN